MNTLPKILICDDDSLIHLTIKHLLSKKFACFSAYNADEAISLLKKNTMNLLLLDIEIRSQEEGLKFIPKFKIIDPELPIIMISARMDFNSVREAMRLGAEDYVPKEFDEEDFLHTIHRVLDRKKIKQTKDQQTFEVTCHQKQNVLIGSSQAMQQVRKMIEKLRQSTAHVLISGETGTGKEVVARLLRGINEDGSFLPFVAVDSATIQSSTAESLLFGHEKGAFTGAEKTTKGIFEEANGGIVYFDEIANMPLEIQAKLLRVLQEKEISRLGSAKIVPLEFHVISATNKDLEHMTKDGLFKQDLLLRLNTIPLYIPPLREHSEDVPELLDHFANIHAKAAKKLYFTKEVIYFLQAYSWPGNVRELSNLVAYLYAMSESEEIDICDLPPQLRDRIEKHDLQHHGANGEVSFYKQLEIYEKELLKQEYQKMPNISKLALKLGMDRSHLYLKLKNFEIHESKGFQHT